jgi:hypothetical protein
MGALPQCPSYTTVVAMVRVVERARSSQPAPLRHHHRPMVVAVVPVRMMDVAADEVVRVIAVRNGFVTTPGSVPVFGTVATTVVSGRAVGWIRAADVEPMLRDAVLSVRMMQVSVVQVVGVTVVLDRGVPTPGPVPVRVLLVCRVCHAPPPSVR